MPGRDQVRAAPFLDLNYASLLARLGARRKLLVRTQPRDNPLSILLLAGMNHHLRRPLFLKPCLVFSEANVTLSQIVCVELLIGSWLFDTINSPVHIHFHNSRSTTSIRPPAGSLPEHHRYDG